MSKIKFVPIALEWDERIMGIGVSNLNQLVINSNKGRVWVNTNAPIEYLDLIEITAINRENSK